MVNDKDRETLKRNYEDTLKSLSEIAFWLPVRQNSRECNSATEHVTSHLVTAEPKDNHHEQNNS